ncbi:MAG: YceI family protein [Cyclobacteriaceae bacterium]|nr:YceI family protein [Cyclobacteriaceae bacterium]
MRILFVLLLFVSISGSAQKLSAEKSKVSFFSQAAIEDIKAENTKSISILNLATGEVAFSIPISDFEFEKSLMKQHFNEKYLESEKYPKSTFAGKLGGFDPAKKSIQQVTAKGKLTIHGVTQEVIIPGTIDLTGNQIVAKSVFKVKLVDYKIKIPKMVWQKIAEEIEVTLEFNYKL